MAKEERGRSGVWPGAYPAECRAGCFRSVILMILRLKRRYEVPRYRCDVCVITPHIDSRGLPPSFERQLLMFLHLEAYVAIRYHRSFAC